MKRYVQILLIVLFALVLVVPMALTDQERDKVSKSENRTLANLPSLRTPKGALNSNLTADFEAWYSDHVGLRDDAIKANGMIQYYGFGVLSWSGMHIGRNGAVVYATQDMIDNYQRINRYTEDEVHQIGEAMRKVGDWVASQGMQLYYMQCYDPYNVYPEYFMDSIRRLEGESQVEQIVRAIRSETEIPVISPLEALLKAKAAGEKVYGSWYDPTHWTPRGAYVGYRQLMETINLKNDHRYRVLEEDDYLIDLQDRGARYFDSIHQEDMVELFTIKNPRASESEDKSALGKFGEDPNNRLFLNDQAGNDTRILVLGDSYLAGYLIDDIAESFAVTMLVWGSYTPDLKKVVEQCRPDIIIMENAERVNRMHLVEELSRSL